MKLIIIFSIFTMTSADFSKDVIDTVNELFNKHKLMFADIKEKPDNDSSVERGVEYPRGDRQKLSQISKSWLAYYECTARSLHKLTTSKRLPSTILSVYEGSTARLGCGLCVAPGEGSRTVWKYTESTKKTFEPLPDHDNIVHEDKDITIYHVEPSQAGVYRCELGRSISGLVILHVVDEEYSVVKPPSSMGPYATPPLVSKDLTIFTSWSTWSECSACGRVGRRRRYGMCYVKLAPEILKLNTSEHIEIKNNTELSQAPRDVFEDYPDGIPCRSEHLPESIRELAAVKQRRNEIMIAMCKVPCTNNTYTTGSILKPLPTRKILFAVDGETVKIRCPGSTLRDTPVSWRGGTKPMVPRRLDEESRGRVHLNARDQLVFTAVGFDDADLYSCWQRDRLAGTIKLVVWGGGHTFWNHHTFLLTTVVFAGLMLRYLDRVLWNTQLQMGNL